MRNTAPEPLPRTRRSDGENMHYGLSDEDKFQFDLQGLTADRLEAYLESKGFKRR